ncbi:MAG: Stp1/IreP family PP2C-type Ser/Thr phosphatase [Bdellovibrionales bacterium]|jgi:serine/threonine protein phosphatase PrpC|nr:Stp1/IreP family PP2C-type Ser/Thr phosphatase [Bdellovibrionales bacterium]
MGILCAGTTDIGLVRKQNQDSILVEQDNKLFVVADGMGGHKGGEVASQIAVQEISKFFRNEKNSEPQEGLIEAISNANSTIYTTSQADESLNGMGTTVVSLLFRGSQVFIGNVGDSRAYLINKDNIYQLTNDHSLVNEKLKLGLYTREQAEKDPNKNVLARSCGIASDVSVDIFNYQVKKNDFFILCSDGLSGLIDDQLILQNVKEHISLDRPVEQIALEALNQKLIQLAKDNGGHDNISVISVLAY